MCFADRLSSALKFFKREQHFTDENLIEQINIVLLYKLLSQEAKKLMSES